jgi:hypothetical protein
MLRVRFAIAFSIFSCTLSFAACDETNDSSTSSTNPNRELSQTDFATGYRDLSCKILQGCCKTLNLGYDVAACQSWFAESGLGSASSVFNPAMGAKCLDEMGGNINCGHTNNAPSCAKVYSGLLEPGDYCASDTDCSAPYGGQPSCDPLRRVCVVGMRGKLNDACHQSCEVYGNGSVSCVWGAASGSADGSVVVNCYANDGLLCGNLGQCSALAKRGELCVDDNSCSRDLYCAYAAGNATPSCQPRRNVGEACVEFSLPCVITAYCNGGSCSAKKTNGQHCLSNAECQGVCNCGVTGDCSLEGSCTDPNQLLGDWMFVVAARNFCGGPLTDQ